MIKLIIFDLDGVLVDSREIHYIALNKALASCGKNYVISREEHLSSYDGYPTSKKLEMLTLERDLPRELHSKIWEMKQRATLEVVKETIRPSEHIVEIFKELKRRNMCIAVATNAIRETTKLILLQTGLMEYIDFFYTNEDVKHSKPNTEMYLKCMIKAGVAPKETLIIEDSHIGRAAVMNSGAYLLGVVNPQDLTLGKILQELNFLEGSSYQKPRWQGRNLNIIVPMAGAGSRFEQQGYTFPKPLIEVNGKPMIQLVIENLNMEGKYIFIVQKSHYEKYNLKHFLNLLAPNCEIVQVDGLTQGAACTTLAAQHLIDNENPLVIANSDQYIDWDSNEFMYAMSTDNVDGGILTFTATHPKWSFVKRNKEGFVCEVAEKVPISNEATVGVYYWGQGGNYVKYAKAMIAKNIRTNNEFYICPVFNEAIADSKKIKAFPIKRMWGLGTPEDLQNYLREHQ